MSCEPQPVGAAEGCDPFGLSSSRLAGMVIQRNNLGLANPVTVNLAQILDRLLHAIPRQTNVIDRDKLVLVVDQLTVCLLYTSPSPRDRQKSRMPSSA